MVRQRRAVRLAQGNDGLAAAVFDMDIAPTIFPEPDTADLDGCEDPTVLSCTLGLNVWYAGFNQAQETGRIMFARGAEPRSLEKIGVAAGADFGTMCGSVADRRGSDVTMIGRL